MSFMAGSPARDLACDCCNSLRVWGAKGQQRVGGQVWR